MKPKISLWLMAAVFLATVSLAEAQQVKVPRIGVLTSSPPNPRTSRLAAFRQGLRDLGYLEGKNIVIEWRYAGGNRERERSLAAELVRMKVEVIVTGGSSSTRFAKEATSTIPIVMTQHNDPVGTGIIVSLARPGGNVTGLSTLTPEISGKRLELLKDVVPKLTRVAVFASSSSREGARVLKELALAAGVLGVQLQSLDIRSLKDFETAFQAAVKGRAEGGLVRVRGPILSPHRPEVAKLAVKSGLPVIYEDAEDVDAGGLMSYSADESDIYRQLAIYVDKILKGAKPADLPIQQPTKFEFIINLNTAKQIGLTIPPNVLARADRVIR